MEKIRYQEISAQVYEAYEHADIKENENYIPLLIFFLNAQITKMVKYNFLLRNYDYNCVLVVKRAFGYAH